jgi:hypothetical protein
MITSVPLQLFLFMQPNVLPVKPSAAITSAMQRNLYSIGFRGMLATDQIILSLKGLLPLIEAGVFL